MTARASALVLLAAMHAVGAQSTREVRLDAGAAQIQQTGRDAHDAAGILGVTWREGSPLFALLLSGAITSAGDSTSAAQAGVAAAWRPGERSIWQTEGGITAATFGSPSLARGGSTSGFVRERLVLDEGGVWTGVALGNTSRDGLGSHSTSVDAGLWRHTGAFEFSASVSRMRSEDFPLLEAAGIFVSGDAAAYDLTDLTTELRYEHGPIVLDASGTWRNGARATIGSQSAFFLSAVWTFSPRYSVVVGSGRQLADPVRGVPDMQINSVTFRVALIPLRTTVAAARRSSFATVTPKSSGALLTVRVAAQDSAHVEVAGTFSDWKPVPLTRTSEGWEAEIALPPGRHRVAVRMNGGEWQAPRGTARVKDDYGGEAGLVVVP